MNLGEFIQHTSPLLTLFVFSDASFRASYRLKSRGCGKMDAWGPNVNSFEAFHMISGFNVETCPLFILSFNVLALWKNIDCAVLSDSTLRASFWPKKVLEMESCSHGIQSLKAFNMNLGYCVQHTGPLKNISFSCDSLTVTTTTSFLALVRASWKCALSATRGWPPVYARTFKSVESNKSNNEIHGICKYCLYPRFDIRVA